MSHSRRVGDPAYLPTHPPSPTPLVPSSCGSPLVGSFYAAVSTPSVAPYSAVLLNQRLTLLPDAGPDGSATTMRAAVSNYTATVSGVGGAVKLNWVDWAALALPAGCVDGTNLCTELDVSLTVVYDRGGDMRGDDMCRLRTLAFHDATGRQVLQLQLPDHATTDGACVRVGVSA